MTLHYNEDVITIQFMKAQTGREDSKGECVLQLTVMATDKTAL